MGFFKRFLHGYLITIFGYFNDILINNLGGKSFVGVPFFRPEESYKMLIQIVPRNGSQKARSFPYH